MGKDGLSGCKKQKVLSIGKILGPLILENKSIIPRFDGVTCTGEDYKPQTTLDFVKDVYEEQTYAYGEDIAEESVNLKST